MSEWKEYRLGDIATFSQGLQVPVNSQLNYYSEGLVRFIRIVDVTQNDPNDIRYITKPDNKYILKKGEIAMLRYANPGLVTDAFDGVIANNLFKISPKIEGLYTNKFLFYALKQVNVRDYFNRNQNSTTMPAINFEMVSNLNLSFPSIKTQTTIAEILSSLDDKIELNNKINQELESLAQTLFRQWFIDFEFPNENGEPYKSSGGEMVDSALGEIPKGWEVGKFGDLVNIMNGYAFKSKDFNEFSSEGIIKIKNINGTIVDITNTDFVSSEVVSKLNNKFKIQTGDILIAMTGADVGKIGVTPESDKSLWLNQRVGKVVPKNKMQVSFIHTMFNVLNLTEVVKNEAMGSAQPNISSQGIEKIKILIPSINLIDEYSSMFNKKYELFYKSLAENQELVDLRDTLLPKLISGELEINEIKN
jgi:type I restriction enzyme S subunit